ncbi:MAG: carbonic anhydrase [Pirellulales bacterium]
MKRTPLAIHERCYIVQNMAGLVPDRGDPSTVSTLAAIQYAVCELGVRHAIVCGHLACRFLPKMKKDTSFVRPGGAGGNQNEAARFAGPLQRELLKSAVGQHVRQQLASLKSLKFVRERLRAGKLRFHAWLLDDDAGQLHSFNATNGHFDPL